MTTEEPVATKYILSITGGGVRDVIPAVVLNLLQDSMKKGTSELFDMIVGVSGGAMMALHTGVQRVVHQKPTVDYLDMFSRKNLCKMLDKSPLDRIMGEVQFAPVYDGLGKTAVLEKYLGADLLFGALADIPIVVPVYNLRKRRTELFASYDPKCGGFPAWQIGDASSAAIPYFPPVRMMNGDWYIDGGYSCNDPVLVAYTEARRYFGSDCNIRIMSLGAGIQQTDPDWHTDRIANWGAIQWMCNGLFDLMMDAPNDLMRHQVARLMQLENQSDQPNRGNRMLCISDDIPSIKLDDYDQVDVLKDAGRRSFQRYSNEIIEFFRPESTALPSTMTELDFSPKASDKQ